METINWELAQKMKMKMDLPDIQKTADERGIEIDQVGVCDLVYPIVVLDQARGRQHVTAKISMSVSLPHHFKGTHMSRFLEVLSRHRGEVTGKTVPVILEELRRVLNAEAARIEIEFVYFIERMAPVSGAKAPMNYRCWFIGESNGAGVDFVLKVEVPIATLCPCSKEISDYGAHNQRGYVTVSVRADFVWIEELVAYAEVAGSAPIYPLLKRVDERAVTMQAYDNPRFVEDVVREVAKMLARDQRIASFEVRCENHESIHNHSAFASVSSKGARL